MSESGKKPTRKARKGTAPEIAADAIERRAYDKFAARGYAHGADFDDWRQAEEELAAELAPEPRRAGKAAEKAAAKAPAKAGGARAARPAPKKRAPKKA